MGSAKKEKRKDKPKMKTLQDDCVQCGRPCLGDACPYRNVAHYYCDECGEEEPLYYYDGEELCANCILERVTEKLLNVEGSLKR